MELYPADVPPTIVLKRIVRLSFWLLSLMIARSGVGRVSEAGTVCGIAGITLKARGCQQHDGTRSDHANEDYREAYAVRQAGAFPSVLSG
jgi:predicted O-methyltransferase YrrM